MRDCPHPEKLVYGSRRAAKIAARRRRMKAYKCECGLFHLTTRNRDRVDHQIDRQPVTAPQYGFRHGEK